MRYSRQETIVGWNQTALREATVVVHGRGWCGAYLVAALGSLGIGNIYWLGRVRPETDSLASWLASESGPFVDCVIEELPFDPEYASMLSWSLGASNLQPKIFVDTGENPAVNDIYREYFHNQPLVRCLAGGGAGGGWIEVDSGLVLAQRESTITSDPETGMAVAGLLADVVRMALCPLPNDMPYASGPLGWMPVADDSACPPSSGTVVVVGVGAIGVSVAALLATRSCRLCLADFDAVEPENLNRQWLFSPEDSRLGRGKAVAARARLRDLYPGVGIESLEAHIGLESAEVLRSLGPAPRLLVSAVDNAAARLELQELGRDLGVPVIQAGTSLFSADCFVQSAEGPTLDRQMHGMLTSAVESEHSAANVAGRCALNPSYVVPGLLAGAMIDRRVQQADLISCGEFETLAPLHWRQGLFPSESRSFTDGRSDSGADAVAAVDLESRS